MPFDDSACRVFADSTRIRNLDYPLIEHGIQIVAREDSQLTRLTGPGTNLIRTFSRQLCGCRQFAANYGNHLRGSVIAVIVKIMFTCDCGRFRLGRERQRTYAGKTVTYVPGRQLRPGKELEQGTQQIFDLIGCRMDLTWISTVRNFGGPYQYLFVPRDDEDWSPVHCFGIDRCIGDSCEAWQHDMRSANPTYHGPPGVDA